MYKNVYDLMWSGIYAQVPHEEFPKPHVDKRHEPLEVLSGHFKNSQLGWSTLENEKFADM